VVFYGGWPSNTVESRSLGLGVGWSSLCMGANSFESMELFIVGGHFRYMGARFEGGNNMEVTRGNKNNQGGNNLLASRFWKGEGSSGILWRSLTKLASHEFTL